MATSWYPAAGESPKARGTTVTILPCSRMWATRIGHRVPWARAKEIAIVTLIVGTDLFACNDGRTNRFPDATERPHLARITATIRIRGPLTRLWKVLVHSATAKEIVRVIPTARWVLFA